MVNRNILRGKNQGMWINDSYTLGNIMRELCKVWLGYLNMLLICHAIDQIKNWFPVLLEKPKEDGKEDAII